MKVIRSLETWPVAAHGSVMALGNFDGVHKGHQVVIRTAHDIAREESLPCTVMTFEPHPRRFFKPDLPLLRIIPLAEKLRQLRHEGVNYLYLARFNKAFSHIPAENFIRDILLERLQVRHVVTGHDFSFGHERNGNVDMLEQTAKIHGFRYHCIDAVGDREHVYSSTAIREALTMGNMPEAAAILGRPYHLDGHVLHGDQRGRQIGFPTANIRPAPLFLPAYGVYAVRMYVCGAWYNGVANLGNRPTVDGQCCLLETHLFDFNKTLYGKKAHVELLQFIRPEQRFNGLDALKAQIARDCEIARGYFAKGTP